MRPLLFLAAVAPLAAAPAPESTPPPASAVKEYRRASLMERSPFAGNDRKGAVVATGPLELRGFFGSGKNLQVSLYRPDTKESAWITVGDTEAKWVVETADPVAGTATVRFDSITLNLKLLRPDEVQATITPAERPREFGRGGRMGHMGAALSEKGRNAFATQMGTLSAELIKSRPDLFPESGERTPQQEEELRGLRMEMFRKAGQAVAKASPEDAKVIAEMSARFQAARNRQAGESPAAPVRPETPEPTPAPAPAPDAPPAGAVTVSTGTVTISAGTPAEPVTH